MNIKEYKTMDELTVIVAGYSRYLVMKRFFDLIVSLCILVVLIPTFLVTSILIKLENPKEKIVFIERRIGINGRVFNTYKFRSMKSGAEGRKLLNKDNKTEDDPKMTSIGRFICSYSIDELPQLFNVLKGEMSLIGPRPSLISEYDKYSEYDKSRLAVKPGITGLWQVSDNDAESFSDMIELDLDYIRTLSLKVEVMIFFKTFLVGMKKELAY